MQDILGMMNRLKRPPLLIRTARLGAEHYARASHLQRVLGYGRVPKSGDALVQLMQEEVVLNDQRKSGDAGYSLVRHMDILIAMVGESRLLRASLEGRDRRV